MTDRTRSKASDVNTDNLSRTDERDAAARLRILNARLAAERLFASAAAAAHSATSDSIKAARVGRGDAGAPGTPKLAPAS